MAPVNSIQYLRALAAISVVAFHASTDLEPYSNRLFEVLVRAGAAGVDVFFVISGFIMYTMTSAKPGSPEDFLKKRTIRIIPLYWIATLALVAAAHYGFTPPVSVTSGTLLKSMFFVPFYNPDHPTSVYPLLVPGWTLNYEMFFYLLFAFSMMFSRYRNGLLATIATILLALFFIGRLSASESAIFVTYTSPLLLEFLGGVLIAAVWDSRRRLPPLAGFAIAMVSVLIMLLMARHAKSDPMLRLVFWGLPAIALVYCALHAQVFARRNGAFLLLGDASYAIYVFHIIVIAALRGPWERSFGAPERLADALAFMTVCTLLSCGLGIAIHLIFERRFDAYLRARLLFRLKPDLPAGAATP